MQAARRLVTLEQALSPTRGGGANPSLCSAAPPPSTTPVQPLTIAFIGFRHGHIGAVYQAATSSLHLEIVGACEEHAPTRESLADTYNFTHEDYAAMLAECSPDIVAIGDYFAIRGARAIAALEAGSHVISDKPLCTTLAELDRIETLSASAGLSVYCQLDMRDSGVCKLAYDIINRQGLIGDLVTISFGGQHALNYRPGGEEAGGRAEWYFEEGKHGGTLTDIAVHGIDVAQWISGSKAARITGARAWSTGRAPHIDDAAQCMLELENGVGVMGDASYLAPESVGQGSTPLYWRMTFHGTEGVLVCQSNPAEVTVWSNSATEEVVLQASASVDSLEGLTGQSYLDSMLAEISGAAEDTLVLTTADVFATMRATLSAQAVADGQFGLGVDVKW